MRSGPRHPVLAAALAYFSVLLWAPTAIGQAAPTPSESASPAPVVLPATLADPVSPLEQAVISTRLDELTASIALLGEPSENEQQSTATIRQQLNAAVASLRSALASLGQAEEFTRAASDVPQRLAEIRAQLSAPLEAPVITPAAGATLPELEQQLAQVQAEAAAARDRAAALETEAGVRQTRRAEIPAAVAALRARLAEDTAGPPNGSATPGDTSSTAATIARGAAAAASNAAARAELAALQAEIASYDARRELLPARRDRALRQIQAADAVAQAWQALVTQTRQAQAEASAREARRLAQAAARQHPVLESFGAEIRALADERTGPTGLPNQIQSANRRAELTREQLTTLRDQYRSVQRRLDATGLSRATGLVLRRQFETLPSVRDIERGLRTTRRQLEDAEYTLIEREETRVGAGDIDRVVTELLSEIEAAGGPSGAVTADDLRAVATDLAIARRDLLDQLVSDSYAYSSTLVDLEASQSILLNASEAYRSFISERILWVKSIPGDRMLSFEGLREVVPFYANGEALRSTLTNIRTETPIPIAALLVLGVIALFVYTPRIRRTVRSYGEMANSYRTDSFLHTLIVVPLTLLPAARVPAVLATLGWVLEQPIGQTLQAVSVGTGLVHAAYWVFPLYALAEACRKGGLVEAHFRWPKPTRLALRRHARLLTTVLIPSVAVTIATERWGNDDVTASLGRIAFTAAMVGFIIATIGVLRPNGKGGEAFFNRMKSSWVYRVRWGAYVVTLLLPATFILLTWLGFYYTSLQLTLQLSATLLLLYCVILANAVLDRWLFIARRRVAIEDAKRRREQALEESKKQTGQGETITEASLPAIDEDRLDLPAISAQTKQLFRIAIVVTLLTGLYTIWSDTLPALRLLDRVQVFPSVQYLEASQDDRIPTLETVVPPAPASLEARDTTPRVDAAAPSTNGSSGSIQIPGMPATDSGGSDSVTTPDNQDVVSAITLADIGLAIILVVGTIVAFRNVPGTVEIVVLQRLPLDPAGRYALSTVLKYAIAIVGTVAAVSSLGIEWSKVQWLAAALTFGLAFGLQEIFANFVSGLIILAERPVRIGDTVTVNNVNGTVTRIRMRATTITDWERKELIIPNKNFITGEVINWSLSDPILRTTIVVGVGYNEDIDLAEKTLLELANANANVLKDPKPYVLFNQFGDSTLNFELRVFLPTIECLIATRHQLHMGISKAFRERDIEIAFPQRDLNIRSTGDLGDLLRQGLVERSPDVGKGE